MFKKLFGRKKELKKDDMPIVIEDKKITIRELCRCLGVPVPKKFENIADEKQTMSFRPKKTKKGDVCLIIRSAEDFFAKSMTSKDQYEVAIEKGAKLIVMGEEDFVKAGLKEENFPVILINDNNKRVKYFIEKVREKQKGKVVMLTGSVGKTTTKDFCYTITKDRFKTFGNKRNTNTPHQVIKHLFDEAENEYDVYIQEAGAGFRGSVRFSAEMLKPDIFILTNIYNHHFQVYKTIERLIEDKTSADDNMPEDGIIITNYDDERIRNYKFKHNVKSFAIHYEEADFRAINIEQKFEILCFDVYEKATGETTPIKINILGEHNVYNALAAFVLGKTLGLSNEAIQEDFLKYKAEGVRQNLSNVGGVYLNLDCYNVAEESIMSMLEAGEKLELNEGGRKIALIGGENKLGKNVIERSERFGEELAKIQFDSFAFCGSEDKSVKSLNQFGDAESIRKGFVKKSNTPNCLCTNVNQMVEFLKSTVHRDDLVMLKGIYLLDMPIAVDKVFGTSYSFSLSHNVEVMKKIEEKGYRANLIEAFGEVEMISAPVNDSLLVVPDTIENYPVFRITENAFAKKENLKSIDFGQSVKNIGKSAFAECNGLTEAIIPSCVKVIEEKAFANCINLESVEIQKGVTHIGEEAFSACKGLKKIVIPSSVGMIGEKAFEDIENVLIICEEDSFAYEYATDHEISYELL